MLKSSSFVGGDFAHKFPLGPYLEIDHSLLHTVAVSDQSFLLPA